MGLGEKLKTLANDQEKLTAIAADATALGALADDATPLGALADDQTDLAALADSKSGIDALLLASSTAFTGTITVVTGVIYNADPAGVTVTTKTVTFAGGLCTDDGSGA